MQLGHLIWRGESGGGGGLCISLPGAKRDENESERENERRHLGKSSPPAKSYDVGLRLDMLPPRIVSYARYALCCAGPRN